MDEARRREEAFALQPQHSRNAGVVAGCGVEDDCASRDRRIAVGHTEAPAGSRLSGWRPREPVYWVAGDASAEIATYEARDRQWNRKLSDQREPGVHAHHGRFLSRELGQPEPALRSRAVSGESIRASIQMMREALAKGKVIMLQTNPSYSTYFTKEEEPPRKNLKERLAFVESHVHFPLACFLMAAEKHAYFSYNQGVFAGTGENGWDIYDTSDLDIFRRPLGPPLGACVRNGFQFRRSFKHLDVAVNVETGETSFLWAKPSVDTRALAAQQAAAKNDVIGATTTSASADESRVWKTADGKFSVEAEFVGFENDIVQLRRTDNNKTVSVPIEKLSRRDQKYIRNHSKK